MFLVYVTQKHRSGFTVVNIVIKSWNKVMQPSICEKAKFGAFCEQLIDQSGAEQD